METHKNKNNRLGGGLILLMLGLIFFFRNLGIGIPDWLFSWHTILIAIGLLIGYRRNFVGGGWMIMVVIGAVFTLEDLFSADMSQYYLAGIFIILGMYLILKPGGFRKDNWRKKKPDFNLAGEEEPLEASPLGDDYIDSVNVFASHNKQVFSKNFKGGDVVAVFGGCDLNLTQADFEGSITLDIVAIFGGIKIIIPPGWVVKTEITPIFGGIDDKRSVISPAGEEPHKTIKITGVAIFGGVDIRNY